MDSFLKIYLQYHKTLNKKLFDGDILKPDVRKILLRNAYEWIRHTNIPTKYITDIIFTGGNAQYNYTKYSDIDVHIIYDEDAYTIDPKFVEGYLKNQKALWTLTHTHVRVKGYPIEMYAQSSKDNLVASGVYSLLHNSWVKKPIRGKYDFKHDDALKLKVAGYIELINHMISQKYPVSEFKKIKEKIKDMRKSALLTGDEFSFDNLLFKSLRNSGILDKMDKYVQDKKDARLSLERLDI